MLERQGGQVYQTLYPEAPGGLQVLTPPGAGRCFGLVPGYWPASGELAAPDERIAREHRRARNRRRTWAAQAAPADGGSGGSFGSSPAFTVVLAAALALLGIAVGLTSRRRRGTT
ncbi:MAG: hypothetical protein ACRDGP_09930 [Actinomycetota bacterium]